MNADRLFWLWLIFTASWVVLASCNGPMAWQTFAGVPAGFGLLVYLAGRTIFVGFRVRLVGRNECVEYADRNATYLFACRRSGEAWMVSLPPTDPNRDYDEHHLSPEQEAQILPRVASYLSRINWPGRVVSEVEFEQR